MKIGITGAAGGIGSVLADRLLELDFELVLIDDLSSGSLLNFRHDENRKSLRQMDLSSDAQSLEALTNCEWIVHLAGISSLAQCQLDPGRAFSVNLTATARIAEFARINGIRLIFASTSAIYERTTVLPFIESEFDSPCLVYPFTKIAGEQFLRNLHESSGLPSIVLRFFNVFGPRQDFRRAMPPLVNYVIREVVLNRRPIIYAPLAQARDYVFVEDLVDLILTVVAKSQKIGVDFGVFNASSGTELTVGEILKEIEIGLDQEIVYERATPDMLWDRNEELFLGSYPLDRRMVEAETLKRSVGSTELCEKTFGWNALTNVSLKIRELAPVIAADIHQSVLNGVKL